MLEFDRKRLEQLRREIEIVASDDVIPTGTLLASIAVSMKRAADALERLSTSPNAVHRLKCFQREQ